mgnify:CR=1 FL=1
MPFEIVRNDITRMKVDAIVNAANQSLLGGGGVDGAIHSAAGPELEEACRALGGCRTGEVKLTPGFALPSRYVIHTVGPIWQGGDHGEEALLTACYQNSLRLAREQGCESVAFPLISAGAYGYPREKALSVAVNTIRAFLETEEMLVYLVVYDRLSFSIGRERYEKIRAFIDDSYITPDQERIANARRQQLASSPDRPGADLNADAILLLQGEGFHALPAPAEAPPIAAEPAQGRAEAGMGKASDAADTKSHRRPGVTGKPSSKKARQKDWQSAQSLTGESLEEYLRRMDEGFRDMLLRKIDESGMTDAECYRLANVDRKLFNKIKNQPDYRPGKTTVLAFAVALRLPVAETREMLEKAGFSLSHSSKSDLIVEYFIRQGCYDVFEINAALFSFDQKLLGSSF